MVDSIGESPKEYVFWHKIRDAMHQSFIVPSESLKNL
jgi:hypothetical protein